MTGIVALVVGAGLGYAGATAFAKSATPSFTGSSFARGGMGSTTGMRGGFGGGSGGLVMGTVAAKDSESITVDTRDGSSHVILVTPNTTVSKSVTGTLDDVSVGNTVIVSGTTNSDGSVSASNVQIRPTSYTAPQ